MISGSLLEERKRNDGKKIRCKINGVCFVRFDSDSIRRLLRIDTALKIAKHVQFLIGIRGINSIAIGL